MQVVFYDDLSTTPRFVTEELESDPVRPNVPIDRRFAEDAGVFAVVDTAARRAEAVLCVMFMDHVPTEEDEVIDDRLPSEDGPRVVVLYSVWSNRKGAGAELVNTVMPRLFGMVREGMLDRIVTLSPKTEMARRFHEKNGARLIQENEDTMNFEYTP
jgi:hypothetical protein